MRCELSTSVLVGLAISSCSSMTAQYFPLKSSILGFSCLPKWKSFLFWRWKNYHQWSCSLHNFTPNAYDKNQCSFIHPTYVEKVRTGIWTLNLLTQGRNDTTRPHEHQSLDTAGGTLTHNHLFQFPKQIFYHEATGAKYQCVLHKAIPRSPHDA